mmetsp:Transcript_22614/g.31516  ORF Transcript_22614/g.31516 Transcript_22614/m.31516 type:complete len:329 (-) Transcript_22614:60-1046(-)|eukprot:CAMPEP_0196595276 /NCGR_PEP_ID=MMETSP1081-20130531/80685_1 /TAXON_ID=36882 /ORGANISM="Pyramimonas amylifera, Strain CCMP720" /LENGTH=328 /DNA_ID=CAMNT_0041919795 /DNA_START=64 /DNA_END=1050 /DNA_ORIENTATION=-
MLSQIRDFFYSYLGKPGITGFNSNTTADDVINSIPKLKIKNKVVIITGCASGLGQEVTRVLAQRDVHVVLACRDVSKMQKLKQDLLSANQFAVITCLKLDLSDLDSVRRCAEEFLSLKLPLHVLINNAGVMACPLALSKQGFEMQFATNHLGHFLLTLLLLPALRETAALGGARGRVVCVASEGHRLARQGVDFGNLNGSKGYSNYSAYAKSKLCNIQMAIELERRMRERNELVTAVSLHPGVIHTNLFRYGMASYFGMVKFFVQMFVKTIPQGAATTMYCAFGDISSNHGGYWKDCNPAEPSKLAQNDKLARKLWDESERLVDQKCG